MDPLVPCLDNLQRTGIKCSIVWPRKLTIEKQAFLCHSAMNPEDARKGNWAGRNSKNRLSRKEAFCIKFGVNIGGGVN